jgi:hypothetical protein
MMRAMIEQEMYYIETVDGKEGTVFVCDVEREDAMIGVEDVHGKHYLTTEERITRPATLTEVQAYNRANKYTP